MTDDSRPSLESIVCAPGARWKHRYRTVFVEYIAGIPACIGLGLAVNIWRPGDEASAIAVAVLGFLITGSGIVLLSQWYRQEAAWKHAELLSRASMHGYSKADLIAYEARLEQEEQDLAEYLSR